MTSVTTSSGQRAVPCTSTCGAPSTPLAVGSLNSIETRPYRRMLYAFCGRAIEVVIRKVPSARHRVAVGQAIGTPDLLSVANSQVRYRSRTARTVGSDGGSALVMSGGSRDGGRRGAEPDSGRPLACRRGEAPVYVQGELQR